MRYDFHRPDPAAMARLLARRPTDPAGTILRLAWLAGLSRGEIAALTWDRVDLDAQLLTLPDRQIPMDPDLTACLRRRQALGEISGPVIVSARDHRPLQPESISRLARQALDAEGIPVSLKDLRQDCILRALETHDWTYAARISGMAVSTLRASFAPYLRAAPPETAPEIPEIEYLLWRILQREGSSPAGLALWMAWQLQMQPGEIAALTWEQVDLEQNLLRLPARSVSMGSRLRRMLLEARDRQPVSASVFATATGRPMGLSRLSTLVRTALIRGGLEQLDLRALSAMAREEADTAALLSLARQRGHLTVEGSASALSLSKNAARARIARLRETGRLTRVGTRYYPVGPVLPAGEREAAVCAYLRAHGPARRADLASLLDLPPRQVGRLLSAMTARGLLERQGRQYRLPTSE